MYAPCRPHRFVIRIFKRPVVTSFGHRSSIFRFLSRVRGASIPVPAKTKQPRPQLGLHRQDQVRTGDGTLVSRGDFVELEDGDFLKVLDIFQDTSGSIYEICRIQGLRFRKTERTYGFSRSGSNELYLNLYMNVLNGKSEVSVFDILCKKNMILRDPSLHRMEMNKAEVSYAFSDCEAHHCNWVRVYHIKDAHSKSRKVKKAGQNPNELFSFSGAHIRRFAALRFDPEIDLVDIETALRNGSAPGARQLPSENKKCYDEDRSQALPEDELLSSAFRELSTVDKPDLRRVSGNLGGNVSFSKDDVDPEYTFGDLFCGCGGASRGAAMAGLHVKWGLDSEKHACDSWRLNFSDTNCLEMDARDFRHIPDILVEVDVLHISSPCQYFSKAHSVVGSNDEANIEAAMIIGDWLDKAKPRIVTLENVDGLMTRIQGTGSGPTVRECFGKIQQQFVSRGYQFSCEVVDMADYGLPQYRNRLIIIAARQGTKLPEMPIPTHSAQPNILGILPHVTVKEALTNVPRWPDHREPLALPKPYKRDKGDQPARTVMKTMIVAHFSRRRNLSLEEYARLQGFPNEHRFGKIGIKKQICNAQPPLFGRILYTAMKKHLQEQDRHKT